MTPFPLTNIKWLNRNLLALAISHGNGFWWILDIFIQRRCKHVSLQKQWGETLHTMHGVAGINKHQLDWPQSTSVSVSEAQCNTEVCSVNHLSINDRENPLYLWATTYELFLWGYSTLKNDYMTFYICHVTCKCGKKKRFHCTSANYSFFELPEKPPHVSVKTFLRYIGVFAKLMGFH